MLTYKDFEEKTIVRNEIFHGKIIDVVVDDVALPNGGTSKRELVFHPGGVAVIAVTEENKMIFVRQFRKAIRESHFRDSGRQDRSRRRCTARIDWCS